MERDQLCPTFVYELKSAEVKGANWRIEKYDYPAQRASFSYERFKYIVFDNVIVVHDMFFGNQKKLVPSGDVGALKLLRYVHLAVNRGFVLYETDTHVQVAIADIDFEVGEYKFIGDVHRIYNHRTAIGRNAIYVDDVSHVSEDCVIVKTDDSLLGASIHLFHVSRLLSSIRFLKTIHVPDYCYWFNFIGSELVFARLSTVDRMDRCYLDNFMTIDLDGEFAVTEIEKTKTCFQSKFDHQETITYPCGIAGKWFNDNFYVMVNFCPADRSLPTTVSFSVFEWHKLTWSIINLNLPGFGFCKFNIDSNWILHILHHEEVYEEHSNEISHTNVSSIRFPLKKPDQLTRIAFFKVQQHKSLTLPSNFPIRPIFN